MTDFDLVKLAVDTLFNNLNSGSTDESYFYRWTVTDETDAPTRREPARYLVAINFPDSHLPELQYAFLVAADATCSIYDTDSDETTEPYPSLSAALFHFAVDYAINAVAMP